MREDRLNRIEGKVDKLNDHLSSIDVTLAAQHESLRDHIRRTNLLEQKLAPIDSHVAAVKGIIRFCGMIVGAAGFVATLFEILTYIHHR